MGIAVEALFTSALGLQPPWVVDDVRLDTAKRRIDFEIGCHTSRLACPACGAATQPVHDRLRRSWRHWTSSSSRPGCTAMCRAWPAVLAARPRRWPCRGASGLGLHRGVRSAGADLVPGPAGAPGRRVAALRRTSGCGGASSSTSRRRVRWKTSPACARWASTRPACGAGSTTSPSCTTWIASGCCSPPRARAPHGGGVRRGSEGPWRRSARCGTCAWT